MLDWLDEPEHFEESWLRAADGPPAGEGLFTGQDDTGSVSVGVDGAGAVRAVQVAGTWRAEVAPHRLGEAVLAARNAAMSALVSAGLAEVRAQQGSPVAHDLPGDPVAAARMLRDAHQFLDDVERHRTTDRTLVSSGGHVVVVLTGGEVTGIAVAADRLGTPSGIAAAVREAFAEVESAAPPAAPVALPGLAPPVA
ncbi:hypothetical protein ABT324_06500 [Saccharopolyspora sp. NPDC000359]|uniref:hypothetical protein n=1 Tax=Saccharopolyspora sp. NPDC000359 TaxID=3154251 RepID=UPI00331FE653